MNLCKDHPEPQWSLGSDGDSYANRLAKHAYLDDMGYGSSHFGSSFHHFFKLGFINSRVNYFESMPRWDDMAHCWGMPSALHRWSRSSHSPCCPKMRLRTNVAVLSQHLCVIVYPPFMMTPWQFNFWPRLWQHIYVTTFTYFIAVLGQHS